jgi:hypothetical protein
VKSRPKQKKKGFHHHHLVFVPHDLLDQVVGFEALVSKVDIYLS